MKVKKEKSILQLFNSVELNGAATVENAPQKRMIKNGYILDPRIEPSNQLLDLIEETVGLSGEKANASFHKSWKIIQDSSMEDLVAQQILHYITTYGFQALGIYSDNTVYIPSEKLKVPKIKDRMPLIVIKGITVEEILAKFIELGSGIALAEETLTNIMEIIEGSKYEQGFVSKIKNRELSSRLKDYYNIVPSDPLEFLRYLVSKLTSESLIIKNKYLIEKIKESNGKFLDTMIAQAPQNLASIFYRFKPLFLAMKSISKNKKFFNDLRRKTKTMHKPLPEDYLNSVTSRIKSNSLDLDTLKEKIRKASIFRKIRLAYALQHRHNLGSPSIVYRVRNGKGWATEFAWSSRYDSIVEAAFDIVRDSIVSDISKNVKGKTIYIPKGIRYALPATEKKFVGNIPTGTSISVEQDMVVGIHWTNTKRVVDLDLSLLSAAGKIGWDGGYRSEELDILFSGDVTSAPKPRGASELFYIKKGLKDPQLLMVNDYNYQKDSPVPAKIIVAREKPKSFGKNYMVNPNNMLAISNIEITKKQNIIGLVVFNNSKNRFYFSNASVGNSISSGDDEKTVHARNYLEDSLLNAISMNKILKMAGANVVREKPEDEYIDLSTESLDKTTIIDLIKE